MGNKKEWTSNPCNKNQTPQTEDWAKDVQRHIKLIYKDRKQGFPGGSVVNNLPRNYNCWSPCTLEPTHHNYWAHMLQLLKFGRLEPVLHYKISHCNEKPVHHNEDAFMNWEMNLLAQQGHWLGIWCRKVISLLWASRALTTKRGMG